MDSAAASLPDVAPDAPTAFVPTADLYDEFGEQLQSVAVQFTSFGGKASFAGPIRTIRCFEDNAMVKHVLGTPGAGAVLVVDGSSSMRCALMGDMIATSAVRTGWAGVVIYGAVRDSAILSTLPLGVKALGTNPRKSSKTGAGSFDDTLEVDGVVFRPGAMLYSDADGILVSR